MLFKYHSKLQAGKNLSLGIQQQGGAIRPKTNVERTFDNPTSSRAGPSLLNFSAETPSSTHANSGQKTSYSMSNLVVRPAQSVNAQAALNKKMRALESAQRDAVKVENLPDGRIRYYDIERLARNPGPTRGSSFVTEYNPKTGQTKQWNECYDKLGNICRIHPKTIDGQDVRLQHYPLTKSELQQSSKKIERN